MINQPLFFESHDSTSGRYLIVEEQENLIWAYLTFPNRIEIEKDCFLGSRIKVSIDLIDDKGFREKCIPLPITREYSTPEGYMPTLKAEDISVIWGVQGEVFVMANERPFLIFLTDYIKGFSKSIAKNGPYGNTWNDYKNLSPEYLANSTGKATTQA